MMLYSIISFITLIMTANLGWKINKTIGVVDRIEEDRQNSQ